MVAFTVGEVTHHYSPFLSRVVRDFTLSPARIGKREREIRRVQNKKELWRLPMTTPDTPIPREVWS